MNYKNIAIALGSALVTFLVLAILGTVLLEDEKEYQSMSDVTAEEHFISSCRAENPPAGFCTCAWDELSDEYTVMEIAEMGNSETFPPEFYDIRDQCIAEISAQQI